MNLKIEFGVKNFSFIQEQSYYCTLHSLPVPTVSTVNKLITAHDVSTLNVKMVLTWGQIITFI